MRIPTRGRMVAASLPLLTAAGLLAGTSLSIAQPAPPAYTVPDYEGADALPEIKLSWTDINGPTSDGAMPVLAFLDYVNQASKGKIQIEVFWSSALMSFGEAGGGIASGLADMGSVLPLYTPSDFPVNNYFNQLSMLTDGGFPAAWLIVTGAAAEFMATNSDMKKELEDFGIHALGASGTGGYDNLCNKPWTDLAGSQGKRTRAAGQSFAFEAQELGMTPVPTTATEVYEAFSRRILDCVILQPNSYVTLGVTDVPGPKYWVNVPLTSFNGSVFMFNKAKWDSLPPVAQDILTDAAVLFGAVTPNATAIGFRKFGDLIRNGSIEPLLVADEVKQKLADYQVRRLEQLRSEAPSQVSDPNAFIDQYAALVDKWTAIVREELGYPGERETITDAKEYIDSWYTEYDFQPFATRLTEELANLQ